MAAEALASLFESYVAQLDQALPEFLSFLDDSTSWCSTRRVLLDLSAPRPRTSCADLQARSRPGGVHVLLPSCPALAPDALRSMYRGWTQEEDPKRRRRATRRRTGARRVDPLQAHVSAGHGVTLGSRVQATRATLYHSLSHCLPASVSAALIGAARTVLLRGASKLVPRVRGVRP